MCVVPHQEKGEMLRISYQNKSMREKWIIAAEMKWRKWEWVREEKKNMLSQGKFRATRTTKTGQTHTHTQTSIQCHLSCPERNRETGTETDQSKRSSHRFWTHRMKTTLLDAISNPDLTTKRQQYYSKQNRGRHFLFTCESMADERGFSRKIQGSLVHGWVRVSGLLKSQLHDHRFTSALFQSIRSQSKHCVSKTERKYLHAQMRP